VSVFMPDLMLRDVTRIDKALLDANGLRCLILDVDNTLTTHNNPAPAEGVPEWIEEMKSAGIKLIIVSNNNAERVTPFAEMLGLHFVPNGAKPLPVGFKRAAAELRALGVPKNRIAAVGDQIFTDILGANLAGIRSIFVYHIEPETSLPFRFKRAVEKPLLPKRFGKFD